MVELSMEFKESIGPRAVLGLLCPTGMGLWVLDTGLGWTKYLSGAGTCLDSRPGLGADLG